MTLGPGTLFPAPGPAKDGPLQVTGGDTIVDREGATIAPGGGGSQTLDQTLALSAGEDIADALTNAAAPDAANVFATMADVPAPISSTDATLSGDVTMTDAGTFYDGPSISLPAGTYSAWYKALFQIDGNTKSEYIVKLWDGVTVLDESQDDNLGVIDPTYSKAVNGFATFVLAAPTTVKISAASDIASQTMLRDTPLNSGASHTATRLMVLKVA